MVAPGVAWFIRLLQHDVSTTLPAQVVTDRKPCLSSTNNDRFDKFRHIEFLSYAAIRITRIPVLVSSKVAWYRFRISAFYGLLFGLTKLTLVRPCFNDLVC